jgi:N-methylhydantoinase A
MSYQLGVDVGGTFTDFVAANSASQFKGKVPTRPGDEATSVLEAVAAVAAHYGSDVKSLLAETEQFVLGTTVVTNTMLEYNGVTTGLITTAGFRDVVELRRGYKESLVDMALPEPVPIVPRRLRKGVTERIDFDGVVVEPLDEDSVRQAVRELRDAGVESIAVCLLFSFKSDVHERRVAEIIAEEHPGCFISLSCDVLPQIREFERLSTRWSMRTRAPSSRGTCRSSSNASMRRGSAARCSSCSPTAA